MTGVVPIGEDEIFYNANGGETGEGGLQFGSVKNDVEVWNNKAEAYASAAVAGFGIFSWARVYTDFIVEENNGKTSQEVEFVVDGEYHGTHWAGGAAVSDLYVDLFIRDLDNNTEVKKSRVMHSVGISLAYLEKDGSFSQTIDAGEAGLEAGKKYAVGVRAKTKAVADTLGLCSSDFFDGDAHNTNNNRVTFDKIEVQWE